MLECRPSVPVVFLVAFCIAAAQSSAKRPRFDDYVVPRTWGGKAAPISLALPSERMFKTRLTEALPRACYVRKPSVSIWVLMRSAGLGFAGMKRCYSQGSLSLVSGLFS
jgi:hypothetical protein